MKYGNSSIKSEISGEWSDWSGSSTMGKGLEDFFAWLGETFDWQVAFGCYVLISISSKLIGLSIFVSGWLLYNDAAWWLLRLLLSCSTDLARTMLTTEGSSLHGTWSKFLSGDSIVSAITFSLTCRSLSVAFISTCKSILWLNFGSSTASILAG